MSQKTKVTSSSHQTLAHWLDDRFTIPGTSIEFGLDPVIGLIPAAGDWFSGLISSYFILMGARLQVGPAVLLRMGFNVLLDIVIGSIPLLGDVFDVGWKANIRNADLLEKYSRDSQKTERHSQWLLWLVAAVMILLVLALLWGISWVIVELFQALF